MTLRRYELRKSIEAAAATFTPRPRVVEPARPVESYGIALVPCPMGRAKIPLSTCHARYRLAMKPAPRGESSLTGMHQADVRVSRCKGCPIGAARCAS